VAIFFMIKALILTGDVILRWPQLMLNLS